MPKYSPIENRLTAALIDGKDGPAVLNFRIPKPKSKGTASGSLLIPPQILTDFPNSAPALAVSFTNCKIAGSRADIFNAS